MSGKTVNGVPLDAILKHSELNPEGVERMIGRPSRRQKIAIVEPNPQWPEHFQIIKSRILAAFESTPKDEEEEGKKVTILAINHVGSTSVPGLPAKSTIDMDLVLSSNDVSAEPYYVPRLQAAGFEYHLREPSWHEHRYFVAYEPFVCNLHVWGPRCPEVERHLIFRDWLREHENDRQRYAETKREAAAVSSEKGELMDEYNVRKEGIIREIYMKAFKELGYLD